MFRSPLDMSSGSESGTDVELADDNEDAGSTEVIEREATNTESLHSNGEYSVSESQDKDVSQPSSRSHHASFLLAGLLEDYSRVRAAEILNASTPGASYDRQSLEVRPLATQLYSRSSVMLDTHRVLSASFTSPEVQQNRSQYLNFIDSATLRTVQGSDMPDAQHLSNLLTADVANMTLAPAVSRPTPSPYQDMTLSTRSPQQLGRYHSDFQQVRLLGQGAFGRVFHVVNAVDQQQYAIKRIPLSARVYSRWLHGGNDSARTFREISTLARVDHPNIVRYFGAWLEAPQISQLQESRPTSQGRPFSQKFLNDRPVLADAPNRRSLPNIDLEQGDGIVFGEDSKSEFLEAAKLETSVQHLIAEMPSKDQQTTSAYSLGDSEIFTDDRSRALASVETANDTAPVLCIQMGLHTMSLSAYLALPVTSTQSLNASARRHCFHLLPSLRLLLGIICGLQYLHTMGIVHRDIKPGNILLSESPFQQAVGFYDIGSCRSCPKGTPYFLNPRIADFGLVADIERSTLPDAPLAYKAAGTELYRPPASLMESTNEKLDVFALGVLCFELLWHFGTRTERAMVLSGLHRGEVPASFSVSLDHQCGEGIGEKVVRCIKGMVDIDATARWDLERVKSWAEELLREMQSAPGAVGD